MSFSSGKYSSRYSCLLLQPPLVLPEQVSCDRPQVRYRGGVAWMMLSASKTPLRSLYSKPTAACRSPAGSGETFPLKSSATALWGGGAVGLLSAATALVGGAV